MLKASQFTGLGDAVFMGRNQGFFHGDTRPSGRIIFPYQSLKARMNQLVQQGKILERGCFFPFL